MDLKWTPKRDTKWGPFLYRFIVCTKSAHTQNGIEKSPSPWDRISGYRVLYPIIYPFISGTEIVGGGLKGLSPYISV